MNRINSIAILAGLTHVLSFIRKEFGYDYYPLDSEKSANNIKRLRPSSALCSLLATNNQHISILNGGVVSKNSSIGASLKTTLYTHGNISSGFSKVMSDNVSLYSEASLYRTTKEMLLASAKEYYDSHRNTEKVESGNALLSKSPKVKDIQKQPQFKKISKKLVNMLTRLSDDVYKMTGVCDVSFNIVKSLNSEIYVDYNSTVVQYREINRVSTNISWVNSNGQFIKIDPVEYLEEGQSYNAFVKKIKARINYYMNIYATFVDVKSGKYPVLLKPSASNVFLHEGFSAHMLSKNYNVDETSTVFRDRLGEKIKTLDGIDVIMDPKIKNGFGSYSYDQEGVPAQKVTLIKNGVINDYLSDRSSTSRYEQSQKDKAIIKKILPKIKKDLSLIDKHVHDRWLKGRSFSSLKAMLSFLLSNYALTDLLKYLKVDKKLDWRSNPKVLTDRSNGHSRVESWLSTDIVGNGHVVQSEARMSNLVVENNRKEEISATEKMKKLCKKSGYQFYLEVESFEGEVDVKTGMFSIAPDSVTKVYLDGRRESVNFGEFAMHLEDLLKNIVYFGKQNEINKGFCGADSGFVPVQSNTPDMIVWDMPYIAGTSFQTANNEVISVLQNKE